MQGSNLRPLPCEFYYGLNPIIALTPNSLFARGSHFQMLTLCFPSLCVLHLLRTYATVLPSDGL